MERDSASFASWLREQVDRRGWGTSDFARAAGVGTGLAGNWLTGKRHPTTASARKIAHGLGINPDVVLDKAGHRPLDRSEREYALEREVRELRRLLGERFQTIDDMLGERGWAVVPVIGRVPADAVRWTDLGGERETVSVPAEMISGAHAPFAVRVSGDCLRSLNIVDGDVVICDRPDGRTPENGAIVIVRFQDEVTMKVWYQTGDQIELRDGDANVVAAFSAFDDFEVLGFYLGLYRWS